VRKLIQFVQRWLVNCDARAMRNYRIAVSTDNSRQQSLAEDCFPAIHRIRSIALVDVSTRYEHHNHFFLNSFWHICVSAVFDLNDVCAKTRFDFGSSFKCL
jgi:hypothetical protein